MASLDVCSNAGEQKNVGFRGITACLETLSSMVELIRDVRPDAAILNNGGFPGGSSLYLALIVLAWFRVSPRIMIIGNYPGASIPRPQIMIASTTLYLFGADMFSLSHSLTRYLLSYGRISAKRVRTIYPGVEHPKSLPSRHISSPPRSIAIVGSVEERKGHEVLIRALALLSAKHTALTVVCIGNCDEHERRRLTVIAERLGVWRQLVWRPYIDDIDCVFANVEILIVPSVRQESFGRVAAEAMARGIPVIASDCGGLPEVIEDGISGIIVRRNDPESLAQALERMLTDPSLRRRLAQAGIARFTALFSATRMANEYAQFLHSREVRDFCDQSRDGRSR